MVLTEDELTCLAGAYVDSFGSRRLWFSMTEYSLREMLRDRDLLVRASIRHDLMVSRRPLACYAITNKGKRLINTVPAREALSVCLSRYPRAAQLFIPRLSLGELAEILTHPSEEIRKLAQVRYNVLTKPKRSRVFRRWLHEGVANSRWFCNRNTASKPD